MGERLEPRAELRRGLAHALGDGPHLAVALGQEDDDAVGLAQAIAAQDDALVAKEAHVPAVPGAGGAEVPAGGACVLPEGGVERAVALTPARRLRGGPPCVGGHVGCPVVRLLRGARALLDGGVVGTPAVEEVARADERRHRHQHEHHAAQPVGTGDVDGDGEDGEQGDPDRHGDPAEGHRTLHSRAPGFRG